MKIIKGLWYLCTKSHSYFLKDHWHYSPMDGYLNGSDNNPIMCTAFTKSTSLAARNIDLMYQNNRMRNKLWKN